MVSELLVRKGTVQSQGSCFVFLGIADPGQQGLHCQRIKNTDL